MENNLREMIEGMVEEMDDFITDQEKIISASEQLPLSKSLLEGINMAYKAIQEQLQTILDETK